MANAQPVAAAPKVGVVKVTLKSLGSGVPDITEAYVRNHIRIRPGDQFRAGVTNPDVHALMRTGRFYDVRVEVSEKDGKLTLEFITVVYPKVTSVNLLLRRPDGTTLTAASLQIKEKDLLKKLHSAAASATATPKGKLMPKPCVNIMRIKAITQSA